MNKAGQFPGVLDYKRLRVAGGEAAIVTFCPIMGLSSSLISSVCFLSVTGRFV